MFPTPIRATAHGLSACVGKAGALLASVLYNYIDDQTKFYVVPWFGLAGMLVTFVFLPDTTGLDLKEQERRWGYIIAGKADQYNGVAVHPHHLSLWERMRGVGKTYDSAADWSSKIDDMRAEWERVQEEKLSQDKSEGSLSGTDSANFGMPEDGEFSREIHDYFLRSSPTLRARNGGVMEEKTVSEPGPSS